MTVRVACRGGQANMRELVSWMAAGSKACCGYSSNEKEEGQSKAKSNEASLHEVPLSFIKNRVEG